jgi:hypothetical protein
MQSPYVLLCLYAPLIWTNTNLILSVLKQSKLQRLSNVSWTITQWSIKIAGKVTADQYRPGQENTDRFLFICFLKDTSNKI